jgi:uncharacterized membrane protein YhaH (DUF805 family)
MNLYLQGWRRAFDFQGFATRSEYWTFSLVNLVVMVLLSILKFDVLCGLFVLANLIPQWAAAARRLHDAGYSGWWQLLSIIPLAGLAVLVMLVMPSRVVGNSYRPDVPGAVQKPASAGFIVAVVAIACIPVIGILAAIAIPAYQDYTAKAHMAAALGFAQVLAADLEDKHQASGAWPPSVNTGTLPKSLQAVEWNGDGRLRLVLNQSLPLAVRGKDIVLQYQPGGTGSSAWRCEAGGVAPRFLPAMCR